MSELEKGKSRNLFFVAIIAMLAGVLLTLAIVAHPDADDDDDEGERVASAIQPASESVVDLGRLAAENGIEAESLEAATSVVVERAFGEVLDVSDLINLVMQDDTLAARIDEAAAKGAASAAEEKRIADLHGASGIASDQSLEQARAAAATDRASLEAARADRRALRASAVRRWGSFAETVLDHRERSESVLSGRDALVELVVRPGLEPPERVRFSGPDSRSHEGVRLAAAPRVDPELQQGIVLYRVARSDLPAGLRLTATIPADDTEAGVVVPREAIVWSRGSAWVFVEVGEGRYERRRVDGTRQVDDGYFETALSPGDRVVTRGAQQLLSQQHKPEPED